MIIKNVNLAKVRKALRYREVREIINGAIVRFDVLPIHAEWPCAYLVLSKEQENGKFDVLAAGFGDWHQHFDEYRNPDRNVAAALSFLYEVVSGRIYLVAGYDAQGKYVNGVMRTAKTSAGNEVHAALDAGQVVAMKKMVFNRVPERIG